MVDDINYLDLLVLRKMDAESTVEKFGSSINTSFFETANLLGTMKIKGLLDIQSSIGGQSPLVITGDGRDLLSEAMRKSVEPTDTLDQAILHALAGGVADLSSLQTAINIRSRDLAFHLHKLKNLDLIDYEVRSGHVRLFLTEKGFNQTGGVRSTVSPGAAPRSSGASMPSAGASAAYSGAASFGGTSGSSAASGAKTPSSSKPSMDSEISDILNFGGWNKPKPTPASAPLDMGAAGVSASKTGAPASAKPTSASSYSAGAPPSSATLAAPAPFSAGQGASDGPAQMDRTSMLFSKLEYYARQYAFYALLFVLLVALVAYALFFGIAPRPGA